MKNDLRDTANEIFKWTKDNVRPSEPHQELMPWVGWFRQVSSRNPLWLFTWPDEDWLHP